MSDTALADNLSDDLSLLEGEIDAGFEQTQDTNLPNDAAPPEDTIDPEKYKAALAQSELDKKRYASLQGQFKSMKEQQDAMMIEIMRASRQQQSVSAPAAPVAPSAPEALRTGFGDDTEKVVAYMSELSKFQQGELLGVVQGLKAELAELRKQQDQAPLQMLRANDDEGKFSDSEFNDHLDTEDEVYGVSKKEMLRRLSNGDTAELARLLRKERSNFDSKKTPKAKATPRPGLPSGGTGSTTAPPPAAQQRQPAEVAKLQTEYSSLLSGPISEEVVMKRIALQKRAGALGFRLD